MLDSGPLAGGVNVAYEGFHTPLKGSKPSRADSSRQYWLFVALFSIFLLYN